uniref:AlNc14C203G8746 protein n=1 Tax=Albugo laibachii Nc14 TaxID=890382 RepID=F0W7W8_9STRA|nr:AlNc14C32G2918 [Albugo laibachii Nc14]CCA23696.1 AlNc14C203G8746 [Albugo laibachii Nc14]|eukprot:CCA23696.1 AlNc14C203G8746 [Albugo laibachii Nc14]
MLTTVSKYSICALALYQLQTGAMSTDTSISLFFNVPTLWASSQALSISLPSEVRSYAFEVKALVAQWKRYLFDARPLSGSQFGKSKKSVTSRINCCIYRSIADNHRGMGIRSARADLSRLVENGFAFSSHQKED